MPCIVGYARPESMAAARWARPQSPTGDLDVREPGHRPSSHVWWKELIKKRRVRLFDAGLVGGGRHLDYLAELGMPETVALGYNAVDNAYFAAAPTPREDSRPNGIARCPRFLDGLSVRARQEPGPADWSIRPVSAAFGHPQCVGPRALRRWSRGGRGRTAESTRAARIGHSPARISPGRPFVAMVRSCLGVRASQFGGPWGLVVNEAAACGLPLLVSSRAGALRL